MGLYAAKNAVLVAAQLNLGNTAARLLLHMALECWDDADNPGRQEPRRYFAGRESSAIALGFLAPDNGSEAAHRGACDQRGIGWMSSTYTRIRGNPHYQRRRSRRAVEGARGRPGRAVPAGSRLSHPREARPHKSKFRGASPQRSPKPTPVLSLISWRPNPAGFRQTRGNRLATVVPQLCGSCVCCLIRWEFTTRVLGVARLELPSVGMDHGSVSVELAE
jgi:hypothetical protein